MVADYPVDREVLLMRHEFGQAHEGRCPTMNKRASVMQRRPAAIFYADVDGHELRLLGLTPAGLDLYARLYLRSLRCGIE